MNYMMSPQRDGGILILKSSNHRGGEFFSSYGGKSIWGDSDNDNQRRGQNSGQNNYHTRTFFYQEKVIFMVPFREKIVFIFASLVLNRHM